MIRVAIVEDEKQYQEQIREYIARYAKEHDLIFETEILSNGAEAVEHYKPVWDIIFMDIKMAQMDGMQAAQKIRRADSEVLIIFITTMAQYAIRGYEVDALDFMLKPVTYAQFSAKMQKAVSAVQKKAEKYLFLPEKDKKGKVPASEILYIEVRNHNLHIVTEKKTYILRYSMKEMEKELQAYHFARCNQSFLVNLKNVTEVRKEEVCLGRHILPISRTKKREFLEALSDYIGSGYK